MSDPERQGTIDEICADIETLTGRLENLLRRLDRMVLKLPPGPAPWPELPNGEGTILELTESEVLQGREPPPGGDPKEGLCGERPSGACYVDRCPKTDKCPALEESNAGYHTGSDADPRD
jgi:hypothetical protein